MDDGNLPFYSILVAVYKEYKTLERLLVAIENFDYPKAKLEILWLVEENDILTINALKALHCSYLSEIIYVPETQLKTKPRALNYGLKYAKGTYITVYDAEDVPHPLQLKKAAFAFQNAPESMICVQATLVCANVEDSILTVFLALEYIFWFEYVLPSLDFFRAPLLLGGSSNHFKTEELRHNLKGWDPYNVTEDADLGLRLWQKGYYATLLDSITLEELPHNCSSWVNQRSRWIKGHLQTYIVHMRFFKKMLRAKKGISIIILQALILIPFIVNLLSPFIVGCFIAFFLCFKEKYVNHTMEIIIAISTFSSVLLPFMQTVISIRGTHYSKSAKRKMLLLSPFFVFYWVLHSVAAFKALWQLLFAPHYWEKTEHGVSASFTSFSDRED